MGGPRTMETIKLNLGGGLAPIPGYINIDIIPEADIRWDLNNGLPQLDKKEETLIGVDSIRCHHVLEHLTNIIPLMNDCYEVLIPGAVFEISTPYANTRQSLQDPTHVRQFVEESYLYFIKDSPFKKEQDEYGITARFIPLEVARGTGTDDWQLFAKLSK